MDFSLPRLMAAWEQVRTKTKAAGVDGITTELFAGVVLDELRQLQRQLRRENYRASPAKGFRLKKKSGGYRLIGIPTVRDRIIQRLILQLLYPFLEEVFSDSSYAYRPGLGVHSAIDHASQLYKPQPTWVIRADISKFFDNLSHPLLLTYLERLMIEPVMVRLVSQQLKSGIVVDRRRRQLHQGVLQGGILSGALANLYLSEFDHLCLETGINLVRYGDDFVVITGGLLEATRILNLIGHWLADIHLELQPDKTQIIPPHGQFTFLGYQFKAGEVIAPESKNPSHPHKKSKKGKKAPVESKPPRVCTIVKHKQLKKSSSVEYWSESMTTLYITEQGAYLKVRHQQFQVYYNRELRISIPVNRVSHIMLFGCCNLSHGAVNLALRRRIPVMFLSRQGRYFGRLQTEGMAEVEYLAKQVNHSLDYEFVLRQAKSIVEAKLRNYRKLLQRFNRSRRLDEVTKVIENLVVWISRVPTAESREILLGYEGEGSRIYFQGLAALVPEPFLFSKRTRRPPTDPINAMLGLGYTLLFHNLYSLVQGVGLHPHFGNLHVPRKDHPALVSDLVEEFRALVVDSLVIYLVNAHHFQLEDFTPPDERGGVYLHPDALKKFLRYWEERLQTEVVHPHTKHKVNYHRCLELQIWEYINVLMEEKDVYQPMGWEK